MTFGHMGRPHHSWAGPEISSRRGSVSRKKPCSETRKAVSGGLSQAQEVLNLTKTEAKELLDYLEAAGYEGCQSWYVDDQGFTVRWQFGSKRIQSGQSHHPELHREQNPVASTDTFRAVTDASK